MRTLVSALTFAVAIAGFSHAAPVAGPVPHGMPDAQIEHKIQEKYAKSKINAEHFKVSVRNGVATIDGKTDVIQHKGVATRMAKTGGAVAVVNRIVVSDAAREKAGARLANHGANGPIARATVVRPARP